MEILMMLWKNRSKTVGLCVMVVTACLVMAGIWAVLATPETALAKKPDKPGGGKTDDTTYYSVEMSGDLTIKGAFFFVDGECSVVDPPLNWGRSFETGIRVNRPLPAVCIATAFLPPEVVTLDGDNCIDGDGVIPHGNGPNWGTLTVESDDTGVFVTWWIGETDDVTGKCRRYKLSTNDPVILEKTAGSGTWPNGDGDDTTVYTVTIPIEMSWSLVQNKPGKLNATLESKKDTIITFTEYVPAP